MPRGRKILQPERLSAPVSTDAVETLIDAAVHGFVRARRYTVDRMIAVAGVSRLADALALPIALLHRGDQRRELTAGRDRVGQVLDIALEVGLARA